MNEPSVASARTEKTEKKRAQIRDAAKQLFLQHGFLGTSTDAILAAAGIASKETLYRYYASKEDLFVDVLRSLTVERGGLRQFMQAAPAPASAAELRTLLRAVAREILENMLQPDYLALIRLTMAELPRFPQLGALFRQTVPEPAMNYLLTLLRNGQAHGVVQQDKDLEAIARMFLGALLTYAIFDGLWLTTQAPKMPEASSIDAIVEATLGAASSPTEQ
ncbi:MAG TPA: TetR/AcrR family transcriptional regulator [Ktedonobacterales bacterium]|nr:TetR/AcrR family transcriptional regulator [Ktedonobacterales bacterium]